MLGRTVSHYRVTGQLGAGGMGVVYQAEDLRLGRAVALKFLPPQLSRDNAAIGRFEREARTASSLNHPNICTIYGIDEYEGQRFIVMELLDGQSLSAAIAGRALPIDRVLELGGQIADALDAAHSQGILHRDIKPANIFITKRGQAKVLDFGLAKLAAEPLGFNEASADQPTVANLLVSTQGVALGTVAYMSPEQARGEPLDPRSDLFSFGIVLYEMATGHQAFPGQTAAVVFDSLLNRMPAPVAAFRADIPPQLDQIIGKALEKDPAMRYQTATDLHADLKRLKRDRDTGRLVLSGAISAATGQPLSGSQPVVVPGSQAVPAAPPSGAVPGAAPPYSAPAAVPDSAPASAVTPSSPQSAAAPGAPAVGAAPVPAAPGQKPPSRPWGRASALLAPPWGRASALLATTWGRASALLVVLVLLAAAAAGVVLMTRSPSNTEIAGATTEAAPAVVEGAAAEPAIESTEIIDPAEGLVLETEDGRASPGGGAAAAGASPAAANTARPSSGGSNRAARQTASAERSAAVDDGDPAPAVSAAAAADPGATLLNVARAKFDAKLLDQAAGDLQTLVKTHPSSASAPAALLMLANIRSQQSRPEDAMAVYVELRSRYRTSPLAAEAAVRYAELVMRSDRRDRASEARETLTAVARDYPETIWGPRALSARADIERRENIKEQDAASGGEVPAALLTWRDLVERYPSAAESQHALWNLANAYEDLRRYDFAAQTFTVLATRFPETRYDAWWKAAELYDRRLRDREAARDAYARVPSSSRNYREAQRKIK